MIQLSGCNVDNCPKVFLDPTGAVVVQGTPTDRRVELGPVPAGEARVTIPLAILDEAIRKRARLP